LINLKEETMRANTQRYLEQNGYTEGKNYLFIS